MTHLRNVFAIDSSSRSRMDVFAILSGFFAGIIFENLRFFFSEMWSLLGADVLGNTRGSSLARISLLCVGALFDFSKWCDAFLFVVGVLRPVARMFF